jgi:multiple sugar transport system permease protein
MTTSVTPSTTPERRAPAAARSQRLRPRGKSDAKLALAFIAPALIGFLVFYIWPTLRGIYLKLAAARLERGAGEESR